ncbi:hypothetical protein ABGB17_37975 [Sphaerisporangium sp. B11E5]|uniref:hypothetical protein n=1 Tax=Sphaerisporangium sp. B11E5 TaxID=3153563 RepID=UPI00325D54C6
MKSGLQAGLALIIGYFLGRHRKFKLLIALAVAGATGRLGGLRGNLVEQGMKLVGSSADVQKIVESVRGDLFEAGKAAAKAAASRQVSTISTRLQERADALQHAANVAAGVEEAGTAAAGAATRAAGGATRAAGGAATEAARTAGGAAAGAARAGGGLRERAFGGFRAGRARTRPKPREEEEPYEEEYAEYGEEEYEEPPRRAPRPAARRDLAEDEFEDDYQDEAPDEEPGRPRGRVQRDRGDEPPRSRPVRRGRDDRGER